MLLCAGSALRPVTSSMSVKLPVLMLALIVVLGLADTSPMMGTMFSPNELSMPFGPSFSTVVFAPPAGEQTFVDVAVEVRPSRL